VNVGINSTLDKNVGHGERYNVHGARSNGGVNSPCVGVYEKTRESQNREKMDMLRRILKLLR